MGIAEVVIANSLRFACEPSQRPSNKKINLIGYSTLLVLLHGQDGVLLRTTSTIFQTTRRSGAGPQPGLGVSKHGLESPPNPSTGVRVLEKYTLKDGREPVSYSMSRKPIPASLKTF